MLNLSQSHLCHAANLHISSQPAHEEYAAATCLWVTPHEGMMPMHVRCSCMLAAHGVKARWAGHGPSEDTWEPIEGLSKCQDLIQDFVLKGFKAKILPRPMSETSGKITPRKAIVEPIVHPSKLNPTLQITMFQLNGNFMEWSQFVRIVMKSKRKMKYILRTSPPPSINDPKVLGKNPLPSISDLFAYVQGEEECKGIMLQSTLIPVEAESSKPPILNVYSRKRQSVVTSNEPILDSEIDLEEEVYMDVPPEFAHKTRENKFHLEVVHRILKCLKAVPGKGVMYHNHVDLQLKAYTDADWARSLIDKRSTIGYCMLLGKNLVTWRSKKQLVVAQSSVEAELLAMAHKGDADVICGGPPCQGISGYNRHRNADSPFDDERNRQIIVFMDIVNFLKPKYVLMENVVDILQFAKGSVGRYALSRLVRMNYQARLGIMAAGCYGLPQYRLRRLPQFALPTHDVILKYGAPTAFERNIVAYDEGQSPDLEKALVLGDAIADLPPVISLSPPFLVS
ncbi:DNA (cytosine-5)-methyltransferase CMT2 [Vitis vinifera]|uniref:DNA (cytosine-5-)-methyltransferase n=1 Tax=Vitis vinifera TaxID=29760 RepID=A0A438IY66_VITVI|nr:DNA (cytosine-5)-methyltransferase CMT2 [Vitis vinifera]